jgi:hypothetical protein
MPRTALPALVLLLPALLLAPAPAIGFASGLSAQEREIESSGLPRDMVDRLISIVNDPATHRFTGETVIPADSVVPGNMVVTGPLRLAGRVRGDVIVVGGDAVLERGFEVRGDITVVDGELRGEELGRIGGLASYFSRRPGRTVAGDRVATGDPEISVSVHRDAHTGASSNFDLRGDRFNRVEGLPFLIGPSFTTGGDNPFRTEAYLILRTEQDRAFGFDRTGYQVEFEQFLGGDRAWRVGVGVHSRVDPIESRGLTDRENGWSTFLFTSDHRDHFERTGWKGFVRATPSGLPIDASLEFRREEHASLPAGDPWSIFRSSRDWRAQPLVAEGSHRTLVGTLTLDTRDGRRDPEAGWFIRGSWRQGLGGSLALPVPGEAGAPGTAGPEIDVRASDALLDVRRYTTVGPGTRFNLRAAVGGAVGDGLLPPQYQHALGGPGSLPGYASFSADCGAREAPVQLLRDGESRAMYPFYGCDRFALFQAEYRSGLRLRTGFGPPPEATGRGEGHGGSPNWVVFFNAGRGWAGSDWGEVARPDTGSLYDAGLGLLLGGLGIYWARPIGDGGAGSRWSLRLDRRF